MQDFLPLSGSCPGLPRDSGDAKVPNVLQLAYIFHLLQCSAIKVFLVCAPSTIFFFFYFYLILDLHIQELYVAATDILWNVYLFCLILGPTL